MIAPHHESTRSYTQALLVTVVACFGTLASCATDNGNLAPEESLEPAGWLDIESSLAGDRYADYMADVRNRLITHRLPHDPSRMAEEIERAAPVETRPAVSCGEVVNGIAILIHGLSDTAFAMQDLAHSLNEQCYIARTVLLPGHGTRAGDMLVVTHEDWTDTVRHLSNQAGDEHDHVVLLGYSLGAVAALTVALDDDSPVDALIAVSPAYHISTMSTARFAPWLYWLYPWIDKGNSDDSQRYESMPTRGVAELVRGMKVMHRRFDVVGEFTRPWMLIQSLDDSTTLPLQNQAFVLERSRNPRTRVVNFYSDQATVPDTGNVQWIPGTSEEYRVNGLSHLAVHVAPENPHYGIEGDYRGCGSTDGRDRDDAMRCQKAATVAYADWSKLPPVGEEPATAISTFIPHFDELEEAISDFLGALDR